MGMGPVGIISFQTRPELLFRQWTIVERARAGGRAVQTHNRCMTPQTALDGLCLLKGTGEARAIVICQRIHKVPVGPIN